MEPQAWRALVQRALVFLLLLGLTSCGGGGANGVVTSKANGPTAGEYFWEFSGIDNNLYVAPVDSNTGQLGSPVQSGGEACNSAGVIPSTAITPSRQFAFVVDKCIVSIHVYSISGPGLVLKEISGSPFYFPVLLDSIAVSPTGNFLLTLGMTGNGIYTVPFNGSTGALAGITTKPAVASGDIREVILDPQGKFAFVNDLTGQKVFVFSVNSNGSLNPVPGSPFTVGGMPENLVITDDGNFLYAPLIPTGIAAFAINRSTGALSNVVGSPFSTTNEPFSLAIGGGGRFVYSIGGSSNNNIEAFTINGGGVLMAVPGSPFSMPSQLGSLTVDASGKFLYATVWASKATDSAILGFAIDSSTGGLTALAGSPYNSVSFPVDTVSLNIP